MRCTLVPMIIIMFSLSTVHGEAYVHGSRIQNSIRDDYTVTLQEGYYWLLFDNSGYIGNTFDEDGISNFWIVFESDNVEDLYVGTGVVAYSYNWIGLNITEDRTGSTFFELSSSVPVSSVLADETQYIALSEELGPAVQVSENSFVSETPTNAPSSSEEAPFLVFPVLLCLIILKGKNR